MTNLPADLVNHVRIYTGRLFYDGSYTDEQRWVKAEVFEALRARFAAETSGPPKLPSHITQQQAIDAFEWLRTQPSPHADIALELWERAARPPETSPRRCEGCKNWLAIGKAFCGDCGRQLPAVKAQVKPHVCVFSRTGGPTETHCVLCGAPTRG